MFIVVTAATLHKYITGEAQRVQLLEKYDNDDMIVIDSDNEYEEDETLARFIPLDLNSEIDSFKDSLVNLVLRIIMKT